MKCWHCLLYASPELARDAITVADGHALCRQHLEEHVIQRSRERHKLSGWPHQPLIEVHKVTRDETDRALGKEGSG